MSDPYFSSVSLLALNDNAVNGTTTFLDQSSSAKTITRNGTPIYDTTSPPTGMTSSGKFISTNPDYLTIADDTSLRMGGSDFTIEGYVFVDIDGGTSILICKRTVANPFHWSITNVGGTISFYASSDGASYDISNGQALGGILHADGWRHFAMSRIGSNWYASLNGVQGSTWNNASSILDDTNALAIAAQADGANPAPVHLASIRITKGVGRYSGNFTPPSLPFNTSGSNDILFAQSIF